MMCKVVLHLAVLVTVAAFVEKLDITLKKLEFSPVTKYSLKNFTAVKVRKYNRTTQVIRGDFEIFFDIDNNVSISGDLFKKQGNEWRSTPFRIPTTPYCDYWKNENFIADEFVAHAKLPPKTCCPAILKGKYTLNDFPVNGFQIPPFFSGEFRVIVKYHHENRVVNEIVCDIDIERYE